jgi:hypothetical protein
MVKCYKNSFGELNKDSITIILNNRKQTIGLKDLVRTQFVIKQKYHINYLAFLLSIFLFLFLKNNPLSNSFQLLISLFAVILLFTSYFFKTYQYRFVLIKKNQLIDIEVSKGMSRDAENLVCQINRI